jgi:transposase
MDRETRHAQMIGWLELRRREGLTYRELVERSGCSLKTLYRWSAKLRGKAQSSQVVSAARESSFVELVEERQSSVSRIEIVLANERRVVVGSDIDEVSLSRVVRALERC